MRRLLIAAACLFLSGCLQAGTAANTGEQAPGTDFRVTLLFTVDGCKVYRFRDGVGSYVHYLTTCPGQVSSTHATSKTSLRSEENYTQVDHD